MVFSSIIFFFFFLPSTILINLLVGKKLQNLFLLTASLFFYAWGEGKYVLIMLASILINYTFGLMIVRKKNDKSSKIVLAVAICLNIIILVFFKYINFIIYNLNTLCNLYEFPTLTFVSVHMPIGISFFTFHTMSYIVDVYRRKVDADKNLINIGLYISLFPQLIAGPIIRYHDISKELLNRTINRHDFAYGIQRFLFGLSKKVLLANPIGLNADKIFALPTVELTSSLAWLGAICYTLQIYFDFSGYSDMAIGIGRIFGFHFLENFNYPYISKSIREFWRRWHISLSNWMRDYLYIPLGGNRHGATRCYLNLFIVFLLCGLWHGANWTFIIWGLYHGLFLALERTRIGEWLSKTWAPVQHGLTIFIVISGWVFFRSNSIDVAYNYIIAMFGLSHEINIKYPISMYLDKKAMLEIGIAIILSTPIYPLLLKLRSSFSKRCNASLLNGFEIISHCVHFSVIAILSYATIISLAADVYNPFIYFRF
jgi:alginate O-acetyltransferase complex protein AlgI